MNRQRRGFEAARAHTPLPLRFLLESLHHPSIVASFSFSVLLLSFSLLCTALVEGYSAVSFAWTERYGHAPKPEPRKYWSDWWAPDLHTHTHTHMMDLLFVICAGRYMPAQLHCLAFKWMSGNLDVQSFGRDLSFSTWSDCYWMSLSLYRCLNCYSFARIITLMANVQIFDSSTSLSLYKQVEEPELRVYSVRVIAIAGFRRVISSVVQKPTSVGFFCVHCLASG